MLLSIIVPAYNSENTLKRCVRSVTEQRFEDWEFLLIENASLDASSAFCQAFANDIGTRLLDRTGLLLFGVSAHERAASAADNRGM